MIVHFSLQSNSKLHHVAPNLYYGNLEAAHCAKLDNMVTVHACKEPCHKQVLHYQKSLDAQHPEYLYAIRERHLYLNMIDPPLPLFRHEMFAAFFAFVDNKIAENNMVIHCNQGLSRAPSLALLYMAKRLNLLSNDNYAVASAEFKKRFPYSPGAGIASFLSDNWVALGA